MKKLKIALSAVMIFIMLGTMLVCSAEVPTVGASEEFVYVNIYDGKNVVLAMKKVARSDEDNDGAWTINDVLISVHNTDCPDGFATTASDYGPMISKLWNVENSGSYGYYLNNNMAMGLTDAVKNGDVLYAYVYADAQGYSDAYSCFDQNITTEGAGKEITLTLTYVSGFDPTTYAPVFEALSDAVISLNDEVTEYKTDENGKVTFTLPETKTVVSAAKEGNVIIPPVFVSEVAEAASATETEASTETDTAAEETAAEETNGETEEVTAADGSEAATDGSNSGSEAPSSTFWIWLIVLGVIIVVCAVVILFTGKKKKN